MVTNIASLKKSYSLWAICFVFIALTSISIKYNMWEQNRITVDAPSYYAYLPSLFIHHDLQLHFVDKNPALYQNKITYFTIENNQKLIKHPLGLSLLLSPFFLVGHESAKIFNAPLDGFSMPYQNTVSIGVWLYLFIGLFYLRKQLLEYFSEKIVALTIVAVFFGTNLLWYSSFELLMTHCVSFSLWCACNYYFIQWIKDGNKKHLFYFSILFALIVLVRPLSLVSIIYFVLLGIGLKGSTTHFLLYLKTNIFSVLFSIIIAFALVSLQFMYWKYATGKWIYNVYFDEHFIFNSPQIIPFLFSFRKGIFIYSPVLLFSFIGIVNLYKINKPFFYSFSVLMVITVYVLSSWWAWSYGICWGIRPMIDYYAFFAFPLAAGFSFFEKNKISSYLCSVLVFFFCLLNLFQTWQYKNGLIHFDDMSREAYCKGFFQTQKSNEWTDALKPYNWKRRLAGLPQIEYSKTFINSLPENQAVYFRGFNQVYVSASKQADYMLTCYFNEITNDEKFYIKHITQDVIAIKASNGKYLSVKPLENSIIVADANEISETEKFILTIMDENDNGVRLQTMDKKYVSTGNKFPFLLVAIAQTPSHTENFRIYTLADYQPLMIK